MPQHAQTEVGETPHKGAQGPSRPPCAGSSAALSSVLGVKEAGGLKGLPPARLVGRVGGGPLGAVQRRELWDGCPAVQRLFWRHVPQIQLHHPVQSQLHEPAQSHADPYMSSVGRKACLHDKYRT